MVKAQVDMGSIFFCELFQIGWCANSKPLLFIHFLCFYLIPFDFLIFVDNLGLAIVNTPFQPSGCE